LLARRAAAFFATLPSALCCERWLARCKLGVLDLAGAATCYCDLSLDLGIMTEMLDSPLWFVDYLRRRTTYTEKLYVPDELTPLSLHLKQNLWLEKEYDYIHLTDDISCDLDAAMMVRRDGLPGKRIPEGILTSFEELTIKGVLKQNRRETRPIHARFPFSGSFGR